MRSLDSSIIESGLSDHFKSEDIINNFIQDSVEKKTREGFNRIRSYKEFENFLYAGQENKELTDFASSFKINVNNKVIGITCFNSSWRCYDSDKDKGNLIIGDYQIKQSANFLEGCDLKIAISHHSLDNLLDFDKNIVDARMQAAFDVHLTGHVHKPDAEYKVHPHGKLYRSVASGALSNFIRTSSNEYQNGFSIIDFDSDSKTITTYFFRYDNLKNQFVPNNNLGDDQGVFKVSMLSNEELSIASSKNSVIKNISTDNLSKLDSHLITYQTDTKAPKTIEELFVMPVIEHSVNVDPNKDPKIIKDLQELLTSNNNYIIFGTKESGKTILLDKLLIEKIKAKQVDSPIPVYIDFFDMRSDVLSEAKNFMGINTRTANDLLEQYGILFLIDNLSFESENKYKIRNLVDLLNRFPKSRIIATHFQLYKGDFPLESELSSSFTYERLVIKDFKAKQIRGLIKNWFKDNDKYETPKKLQTIVDAFQALALPRTPFAVSMFLWIIEKQENTRPINNSTLIENFIEKLLDKQNKREILSERFDFKNQIRLLADIAYHMYKENGESYKISFADLTTFVEGYLSSRDFHMSSISIVNQLLSSGLFHHDFLEKDYIRFRFTCFFEFFLVKKMEVTSSFREEVLGEDNYLNFINEIDYFTGLHREETQILELILSRLNLVYEEINSLLPQTAKSIDDLFNTTESIVSKLDKNKVMKFLPMNKPTEEDLDIHDDRKLEIEEQKGIKKKESENNYKDLIKVLILAMRVLKNSEEVSKEGLKQYAFETVLKNSISFAVIYKIVLQFYISQNKDYDIEDLKITNNYLPMIHESFVFNNVGTLKLSNIIKKKIDTDLTSKNLSEFEKFMTVFLYADIRGPRYLDYVSALIKTSNNNYILYMAFFKKIIYYFFRSKDQETDNIYLNLIGDIFVKTRGVASKSKVMEIYKKRKEKNERQMKLNFDKE